MSRWRNGSRTPSDPCNSHGQWWSTTRIQPDWSGRAWCRAVARAHDARVVGYLFDVLTREAVARNAERTGSGKVPNVAICATAKRLEPPTAAEGFEQLFSVASHRSEHSPYAS